MSWLRRYNTLKSDYLRLLKMKAGTPNHTKSFLWLLTERNLERQLIPQDTAKNEAATQSEIE